ncbi:hypothetical protein G6F57_007339 [Rhizopus arrhizus]|uniref:Uncharacterized protein n=1 Tax=Rhizopus oryzae TaxID=64495 RepID=A0A9P6X2W3_RHIOR|nr:hypothetical protein G6F23_009722 [Rhizopus arrhizus]KAG1416054.1 hypothetical protein G6F58_006166 [Rhizopus delemar]KAG0784270.1 hypothetical protein G6F22_008375 [Rhizopus arrhizus]KAG0788628.1 hypothetical protein G6F21_007083 [Rhizopus arrhizus]KAG0807920.1 hypothetical protein G6F20_009990 [Rhizopus arrhizus]
MAAIINTCSTCQLALVRPLTLPCGYTCCTNCHRKYTACVSCDRTHTMTINPNVTLQAMQAVDVESKWDAILECAICCNRFNLPTTTPCGHTFCRNCLVRSLDHQHACPFCRDPLDVCPPPNQLLSAVIQQMFGEEASADGLEPSDDRIPLMVGSLAFPGVSCVIHVFEPRYRLMLRRVMQSGRRRFGLCLLKRKTERGYYTYGTMLELMHVQTLPDGRSIVEAVGSHRFHVVSAHLVDGYHLAEIERVDDLDREQQQMLEQQQILRASASRARSQQQSVESRPPMITARPRPSVPLSGPRPAMIHQRRSWAHQAHPQTAQVNRAPWLQMHVRGLSVARPKKQEQSPASLPLLTPSPTVRHREESGTDELIDDLVLFIRKLIRYKQSNPTSHWLAPLGDPPPLDRDVRDRVKLIWWISNLMPLSEEEKIPLLTFRTLRERVLLVTLWKDKFEDQWSLHLNTNNNNIPSASSSPDLCCIS